MPIIRSAKKKLRHDKKKTAINLLAKKKLKETIKKARRKPTPSALKLAYSLLDQSAKKKLIHQNKANRLKSRLARLIKPKKANK